MPDFVTGLQILLIVTMAMALFAGAWIIGECFESWGDFVKSLRDKEYNYLSFYPHTITDPILAQDLTQDTCIYGALAKSMEACLAVKAQAKELNEISKDVKHLVSDVNLICSIQVDTSTEIMKMMAEISANIYCQNRKIVVFFILLLFGIISIIIFEMLY